MSSGAFTRRQANYPTMTHKHTHTRSEEARSNCFEYIFDLIILSQALIMNRCSICANYYVVCVLRYRFLIPPISQDNPNENEQN